MTIEGRQTAHCNITPGGFVWVGPPEQAGGLTVSVQNEYTYDPGFPDQASIRNVENQLQIAPNDESGDIGDDRVVAPITRDQCYELAWMFLSVARSGRNWS